MPIEDQDDSCSSHLWFFPHSLEMHSYFTLTLTAIPTTESAHVKIFEALWEIFFPRSNCKDPTFFQDLGEKKMDLYSTDPTLKIQLFHLFPTRSNIEDPSVMSIATILPVENYPWSAGFSTLLLEGCPLTICYNYVNRESTHHLQAHFHHHHHGVQRI